MAVPQNLADQEVCVVGLGYVGMTLAVAMADKGFRVHGLEINPVVLDALSQNRAHFHEPRLDETISRVLRNGRFTFSAELNPSIKAQVYIITVGTPLDKSGAARLDMVRNAGTQVARHCGDGALVILRSTVKLRTTRDVIGPIFAEHGRKVDLAFCPERTLEGRALIELTQIPQIIGADTPEVRIRAAQLFNIMTPTTIQLSSLEAAELLKLVDNTYRDVSFAFANEIARLCSAAGLSAIEIISAGKFGYPRTNVAIPGPVGGPCLEKDPHILTESAKTWGVTMGITSAARQVNEMQPEESVGRMAAWAAQHGNFSKSPKIVICGVAFKGDPPTDDLRGTMAAPILQALKVAFPQARLFGYDAVVEDEPMRGFGLEPIGELSAAFDDASIVVIQNNHPVFRRMDVVALAERMQRPGLIYDFWNLHSPPATELATDLTYAPLGGERIGV
ncbi:MAG: nucleotide sugar dehydrogenase [Rhodospirillales bacterium]|nr:nucleotide sugar dehydrogenase [Rhodospirillales bacterium]